ncbi:uncharacterized protein PG998_000106 [Apiospora kogelbergensis]|uniref:uncharacterized protein n=1 Tax=Apiospora kogelbergensis TaxID=1337665 RepID=UPI0031304CBB
MNWTGRYLRVLLHGLSRRGHEDHGEEAGTAADPTDALPDPSPELNPPFIVHGTKDDLVPWQQALRTHEALRRQGVRSEIRILDGAVHLFDMYRSYGNDKAAKQAVGEAYEFLRSQVFS